MKLSRYILASLLGLAAFVGCDDEEEETYLTMSGSVVLTPMPAYVAPGDTFTFHASGVSVEDGVELTCKFKSLYDSAYVNYGSTTFGVRVPDTTGTFSVSCSFSADGYYSSSMSVYTTILKDESLVRPLASLTDEFCTDVRDGNKYLTKEIGLSTWMCSNLSYFSEGFGTPLENAVAAKGTFGAFYTWAEAASACPSGWRLPESAEFAALTENSGHYMFRTTLNGEELWPRCNWPSVDISNSTGFAALPFGYGIKSGDVWSFSGFGGYAVFWAVDDGQPCCWYLHDEITSFKKWTGPTSDFLANIRCVKSNP